MQYALDSRRPLIVRLCVLGGGVQYRCSLHSYEYCSGNRGDGRPSGWNADDSFAKTV